MGFFVSEKEKEAARLAKEQAEEKQRRARDRAQQEEQARYRQKVLSQIEAVCNLPRRKRPDYIDQYFAADHGLGAFLRQELPKEKYGFYRVKVKDFFSDDDCIRVQVTGSWSEKGWKAYQDAHPVELAEEKAHEPPAPPPQPEPSAGLGTVLLLLLGLLAIYFLLSTK